MDDVPFLDALQKLHTKQSDGADRSIRGKIAAGHVLMPKKNVG